MIPAESKYGTLGALKALLLQLPVLAMSYKLHIICAQSYMREPNSEAIVKVNEDEKSL